MLFRQIIHEDLGCASYLIGDAGAGVAAVVDPRFEIDDYLELARYTGVRIEHVFETHNHADHVSGHGRLAAATGAQIHVHRLVGAAFDHLPFDDGDEFALGRLRLRVLHTPGHRPEHCSFVLVDTARGNEPWAVLSGDTLFVGDVARPDLAVEKTEGARAIYASIRDRLLALPDHVEVWPGHLGGSMCGGPGMVLKVSSTIGYERAHNTMLGHGEAAFVDASLAQLGAQPPNFRAIVERNQGPLQSEGVELPRLFPGQLDALVQAGALLVDVRTDVQFSEAHIPSAISIPLHRSGFGTKLAWLAAEAAELVFIGRDSEEGRRAGALAAAVGLGERSRLLTGGMTSWTAEGLPLAHLERLPVGALAARLERDGEMQLLDCRETGEYAVAHLPDSRCVPWHDIRELPDGFDPARPIAVLCASGQRAGTAASLLQRFGAAQVVHVTDGGVPAWCRAGGPVCVGEHPTGSAA